jgi:hypothetical protein
MRLAKRLLVLFLVFWLPTSVVVAGSMSLAMSGTAQVLAEDEADACPQHSSGKDAQSSSGECYGCSFCQFACTAMLTLGVQSIALGAGWLEARSPLAAGSPFISDRLQRPPLAL